MSIRTKSFYPHTGHMHVVDLFGYATKGIPGIEIVGLGKYSRTLKEKFIYLTKQKELKLPLKRYVLCVEGNLEGKKFIDEEYRYLELPLLLILWSLSGHLQLEKLDDCFSCGKVSVEGEVKTLDLNNDDFELIVEMFGLPKHEILKIIAPKSVTNLDDFYHIPLEDIWSSIGENKKTS